MCERPIALTCALQSFKGANNELRLVLLYILGNPGKLKEQKKLSS